MSKKGSRRVLVAAGVVVVVVMHIPYPRADLSTKVSSTASIPRRQKKTSNTKTKRKYDIHKKKLMDMDTTYFCFKDYWYLSAYNFPDLNLFKLTILLY